MTATGQTGTTLDIFGSAFDPDLGALRMSRRLAYAANAHAAPPDTPRDPYDVLAPYLEEFAGARLLGKVPTESWLTPFPAEGDADRLKPEALAAFLSEDGCRNYACTVKRFVEDAVSGVPAMIGIDHSATGGAVAALSERHGAANLGLVVLDAHTDLVPAAMRRALMDFARGDADADFDARDYETLSPQSDYDCGSFLLGLLDRGLVAPRNLVLIGCADGPAPRLAELEDERVRRYLRHRQELLDRGVTIVARDALMADPAGAVAAAMKPLAGKPVYLSVDLDVASQACLTGARFVELEGVPEWTLAATLEAAFAAIGASSSLAGIDVMEFDFYRAGAQTMLRKDLTYDVALHVLASASSHMKKNVSKADPGRKQ